GVRVHESTITQILQTKDKWLTTEIVNPKKKKNRAITVPVLELAFKEFVLTYQYKMILDDALLIKKAKLLASRLGVPEDLNFSDPMQIEEYLDIPDKNIIYKVPDNNQIISDLVETFRERSDEMEDKDPEEASNSVEKEIVNPSEAFKSLDNICTFLLQQEGASEYI
ncbi:12062_t:CDS:2, partial [Dentiscutata heterogama]